MRQTKKLLKPIVLKSARFFSDRLRKSKNSDSFGDCAWLRVVNCEAGERSTSRRRTGADAVIVHSWLGGTDVFYAHSRVQLDEFSGKLPNDEELHETIDGRRSECARRKNPRSMTAHKHARW